MAYNAAGARMYFRFLCAFLAVGLGAHPAYAIPSPELVVGSLSSISQLFALFTALIGGSVAVGAVRIRSHGSRFPRLGTGIILGLIVLCAASIGFNFFQYFEHRNEAQARLEATLLRPAKNRGMPIVDPTVKELSFSEQKEHPLAIDTDEADRLRKQVVAGERDDVMFLDVRETAETRMGNLPGAIAVRFPDFSAANLNLEGKKALLFCHNGNRSHETCEALAKLGVDCRFIVGGVEKWVVERRALTGLSVRSLDQLRAIPSYPEQRTLLDTPEVKRLVETENAQFVDVRYPKEFESGHLPDAISLAIRRTPTAELQKRIAELPRRPIIIPCYDRRGCFFSEVLGFELTRAGHDFRGRYTVPWEYFIARPRPPHVEQWVAANSQGWWSKGAGALGEALSSLGDRIGLPLAIILLAIASRLLVLPFSIKAERDQIRSREIGPEIGALKARFRDDPKRLSRALRAAYRRNGLTPLRNLAALLFLPIMALAISAIQWAAEARPQPFLWIDNLAGRDTLFILPLAVGALLTLYLHFALAHTRKQRVSVWLIAFPLLVATGVLLSAAADLYIIASAVLLLVQRAIVDGQMMRMWTAFRLFREDPGVISLDDPDRLAGYGNKAHRLALLKQQDLPVPDGLVLTPEFIERLQSSAADKRARELDALWRRLGASRVAVRSSAVAEDGENQSYAGVFESVLNVDRPGLADAIAKVSASYRAARVRSYGGEIDRGSVLLQRMIDADYAGVLFTRHPASSGLALVEMVRGTAESMISGAAAPDAFSFGRQSARPMGTERPPIDMDALIALGRDAEELFGAPQDIEWVYHKDRFLIVQSRDITRLLDGTTDQSLFQHERARLLELAKGASPDEIVFAQTELAEMLPRPTPLSLELQRAFLRSGGSVDLACRSLGLRYRVEEDEPDQLLTVFGRVYTDKRLEKAHAVEIGPVAGRRLRKRAAEIEGNFREHFLPAYLREIAILEAVDFDLLPLGDLVAEIERIRSNLVTSTHVEVNRINVAARFYLDLARVDLTKRGLEPAIYLSHIPETVLTRAIKDASMIGGDGTTGQLMRAAGHRAIFDYELAEARYAETPDKAEILFAATPLHHSEGPAPDGTGKALEQPLDRARRFQTLKEDAKHHALRELAVLRKATLSLAGRTALGELIFFLTFEEIARLDIARAGLLETARHRHATYLGFKSVPPLPAELTVTRLETLSLDGRDAASISDGALQGTRVSGSGVVVGRARVIATGAAEEGAAIPDLEPGDIIVSRFIHPVWLPLFRKAGGVVSDIGGWLSHTAILARECDLPMIVGVHGLDAIADGDCLRLSPDGRVEVLKDEGRKIAVAAE